MAHVLGLEFNLNVKIINRSSQPIYIDYIQTYGEYVKF